MTKQPNSLAKDWSQVSLYLSNFIRSRYTRDWPMLSSKMALHMDGGISQCVVAISFACKSCIAAPYFEGSHVGSKQALAAT